MHGGCWTLAVLLFGACASGRTKVDVATQPEPAPAVAPAVEALAIGESFTIDSRVLGEVRRINVFVPTIYGEAIDAAMPVLYMPDGGMGEDFLHVMGLVQVSVSSGVMRPFMLVGIENTERRRDMTGPTTNAKDMEIAPVVGGSAAFRRFIAEELMPTVARRYRVTDETAIVGESLAGLFVMETFFLQPELFDAYVAIDPSLWWADQELLRLAEERLAEHPPRGTSVFLASSNEPELAELTSRLAVILAPHHREGFSSRYEPFSEESHATIYHPAALRAFRVVFAPG